MKVNKNSLTAYINAIDSGVVADCEALVLKAIVRFYELREYGSDSPTDYPTCEDIQRLTGIKHENVSARIVRLRYHYGHIKGETVAGLTRYRLRREGEPKDEQPESKQDRQIRELTAENAELKLQVKALTVKCEMYLNNWVLA